MSEHVDCSFDNTAEKFSKKGRQASTQFPKMMKTKKIFT